jgi:predicted metal-binding membrane protein
MIPDQDRLDHLDPAARATAAIGRRPRLAVYLLVLAAALLSWAVLGAIAVRDAAGRLADGPGGNLIEALPELPLPAILESFVALCLVPVPAVGPGLYGFSALALMWMLMSVAMMLPSAAPLISSYCEIVDTALARGAAAVHPVVLLAGYMSTWLAASLVFASATLGIQAIAGLQPLEPLAGAAGAVALGVAGAYQFTALKDACIRKCRNPFGILFSRWSTTPAGIFRLGAGQGAWCLGCCWALMLVMFAVGTMNVFWMALIALFALVEKQAPGRLPTRIAGSMLLVWAAALLVISTGPA